jgi:hypothetical protein
MYAPAAAISKACMKKWLITSIVIAPRISIASRLSGTKAGRMKRRVNAYMSAARTTRLAQSTVALIAAYALGPTITPRLNHSPSRPERPMSTVAIVRTRKPQ